MRRRRRRRRGAAEVLPARKLRARHARRRPPVRGHGALLAGGYFRLAAVAGRGQVDGVAHEGLDLRHAPVWRQRRVFLPQDAVG